MVVEMVCKPVTMRLSAMMVWSKRIFDVLATNGEALPALLRGAAIRVRRILSQLSVSCW